MRVFRRDVKRLLRVPKSFIIVVGIIVTPALYAWFNINAFWDPYENTAHIAVAVVNLDEGATSDLTGPVDVGARVVGQLEDNDQLGWTFMDEAEAAAALRSGDVYASMQIPADFSADLLSVTSGTFAQPALVYSVNEKLGAISPKITDVGASTLDEQITSAFTEQVAEAATKALRDAGVDVASDLTGARDDSIAAFEQASQTLGDAREKLERVQSGIDDSRGSLADTAATLRGVDTTLGDVQTAIAQAQSIIADAQQQVVDFTDAATTAYVDGATALADATSGANVAITELTQTLDEAGARVDGAITSVTAVAEANGAAIQRLQDLVDTAGFDEATTQRLTDAIGVLQERNATDQQLLSDLQTLNTDVGSTVDAIQAASDSLADATSNAQSAAGAIRGAMTESVPALNQAMSTLSTSAGAFSAAIDAQRGQLSQARTLLGQLDTQLVSTGASLESLDANLAAAQDGLDTAQTDVAALGTASVWNNLATVTGLDPAAIAAFIASPVSVDEQVVYPVDTYGSAMAALFTNLSLWIGAFVLTVIFKIEVDTEEVEDITVGQAYVGRFLLFACLATAQALLVCIGNLVIGIQTVNPVAYVATGVFTGLTYLSIIYALCAAFGHVGRGLAILLVIMQIPGASGLYPIELMPAFFRAIYPLLPFTYGIDAMRETIGGFYDGHYWRFMGVLALFIVLAFVVGMVLRRRLAHLNRMFNRRIAQTDLLIGENVQVVGSDYRLTDVMHALSNRREYRDDLARRSAAFAARYRPLVRLTLLAGLAGLIALGVVAWAIPGAKPVLLGIWVLWILLVIAFLVTLEYVRDSFESARLVDRLDDDALRDAVVVEASHGRLHVEHTDPPTKLLETQEGTQA